MNRTRRTLRVCRTALLCLGVAFAVMYAASWRGVWWMTSTGSAYGLYKGQCVGYWWGQAATVTGVRGGFRLGDLSGSSVKLAAPPGATVDVFRSPVHFVMVNHGRTGPGPRVHNVAVEVRLLWIAIATCSVGASLMCIRTRPYKVGLCRACGYDRGGIASDAKCPECGAPCRDVVVAAHR